MTKQMTKDSKKLSYILRHHPEEFNCKIDSFGWVLVQDILDNTSFTMDYLKEIVNEETRYTFNDDFSKIKAFHGHSVKGVIYTNEVVPPLVLYHGTSEENFEKIKESKMIKGMSRVLVHLSETKGQAKRIGKRHGKALILVIDCEQMTKDGIKFYKSEDGVFLTNDFSTDYIKEVLPPL